MKKGLGTLEANELTLKIFIDHNIVDPFLEQPFLDL